jgi:hypothetical protein
MNAYTTMGQARIRQRDIMTIVRTDRFMAGASLAALERHRGDQAASEVHWLLKQHGVTRPAATPRMLMFRQMVGAALIWAGERLAGAPHRNTLPGTAPVGGKLSTADC